MLSTRLRKDKQKKFKGSVFVEFASEEEAKKVAQLKLQHNSKDLVIMMRCVACVSCA